MNEKYCIYAELWGRILARGLEEETGKRFSATLSAVRENVNLQLEEDQDYYFYSADFTGLEHTEILLFTQVFYSYLAEAHRKRHPQPVNRTTLLDVTNRNAVSGALDPCLKRLETLYSEISGVRTRLAGRRIIKSCTSAGKLHLPFLMRSRSCVTFEYFVEIEDAGTFILYRTVQREFLREWVRSVYGIFTGETRKHLNHFVEQYLHLTWDRPGISRRETDPFIGAELRVDLHTNELIEDDPDRFAVIPVNKEIYRELYEAGAGSPENSGCYRSFTRQFAAFGELFFNRITCCLLQNRTAVPVTVKRVKTEIVSIRNEADSHDTVYVPAECRMLSAEPLFLKIDGLKTAENRFGKSAKEFTAMILMPAAFGLSRLLAKPVRFIPDEAIISRSFNRAELFEQAVVAFTYQINSGENSQAVTVFISRRTLFSFLEKLNRVHGFLDDDELPEYMYDAVSDLDAMLKRCIRKDDLLCQVTSVHGLYDHVLPSLLESAGQEVLSAVTDSLSEAPAENLSPDRLPEEITEKLLRTLSVVENGESIADLIDGGTANGPDETMGNDQDIIPVLRDIFTDEEKLDDYRRFKDSRRKRQNQQYVRTAGYVFDFLLKPEENPGADNSGQKKLEEAAGRLLVRSSGEVLTALWHLLPPEMPRELYVLLPEDCRKKILRKFSLPVKRIISAITGVNGMSRAVPDAEILRNAAEAVLSVRFDLLKEEMYTVWLRIEENFFHDKFAEILADSLMIINKGEEAGMDVPFLFYDDAAQMYERYKKDSARAEYYSLEAFKRAEGKDSYSLLLDTLAAIRHRQGRSENALKLLRHALSLDPESWLIPSRIEDIENELKKKAD